jgi:hypothetical protein
MYDVIDGCCLSRVMGVCINYMFIYSLMRIREPRRWWMVVIKKSGVSADLKVKPSRYTHGIYVNITRQSHRQLCNTFSMLDNQYH